MTEATRILKALEQGDKHAADQLLPLVYDELRQLAARQLERESPGQTLGGTSLVHEAYLRLVGSNPDQRWNGRGHFFAAAAEAMRRILVENARRKGRRKRGGDRRRVDLDQAPEVADTPADDLLALDEVLSRLEATDALAARLVKLRYFVGLTMPEAAQALGISLRNAERNWTYARTWLARALAQGEADDPGQHPDP